MDMFDELKNKGKDIMNDSKAKAKIEQIAKEKGISIEEAKQRFMKRKQ